jgi:tRNA threonylcarbamoyladenosine biosynthesis protein TsaB
LIHSIHSMHSIHSEDRDNALLLGIDTCGATGSVALARVQDGRMIVLGEASVASRECAAGLVPAIAALLDEAECTMGMLSGVVVVHGPGSFTGIRVGVATAKGLVEARALPLLAISRLAILAAVAGTDCAALDAWRGQIFVNLPTADGWQERLVTAGEFRVAENSLKLPERVAVCEESVAQLLETLAEESHPVRVAAPGARQALEFALQRWLAGKSDDAAALDGHYLRGTERGIDSGLGHEAEARAAAARNAQ